MQAYAKRAFQVGLSGCLLLALSPLGATNGTFLTGCGARSAAMGGATLAVGGMPLEIQSNPSSLSRLSQPMIEGGVAALSPEIRYQDAFYTPDPNLAYTNRVEGERNVYPIPSIAFATPFGRNWGFGVAFYGLGGAGADVQGIRRPLNDPGSAPVSLNNKLGASIPGLGDLKTITENTYSNLSTARLTSGLSVRLGDLHVGAALDVDFSRLEFRYTFSDPTGSIELPGAGYRYRSDTATSASGKLGLTYELSERLALAYSYQAKSRSYYDGTMSVNAGNAAFGNPARTSMYLESPERHRAGLAYKIKDWTLGLEASYIKWAAAFRSVDFNLDRTIIQTPFGNSIPNLTFNQFWEDQRVYSIGVEYRPGDTALRAGYNYGRSPLRGGAINPIFPAITERHASLGMGLRFGNIDLDLGVVYAFPTTIHSSDSNDWEVLHAAFGIEDVRTPAYESSVRMRQIVPYVTLAARF